MSSRKIVTRPITLTKGGTPIDILVGTANEPNSLASRYRVTGTQTLSGGNFTIVPSGTPYTDETIELLWEASATLSGNSIQFFGTTIPAGWETLNWTAKAVYNGSAWVRYLSPDFETAGSVLTDDIADEAVTPGKMSDLSRGYIYVGNSSDRPTGVDFNGSGYIGIGDGTDYNSVAQSGDVIFNTSGVSAIQAGVIVNADINASAAITASKLAGGAVTGQVLITNGTTPTWTTISGDATLSAAGVLTITATSIVKTVKLTIPTASVLTLYTTPLTVIAAPGAGYAIEVISAAYRLTFNSIAYATNTTLRLIQDTADVPVGSSVSSALAATITQMSDINAINNPTSGQTKIIENKALKVTVATGDPTAGDSQVDIYVTYRIITL